MGPLHFRSDSPTLQPHCNTLMPLFDFLAFCIKAKAASASLDIVSKALINGKNIKYLAPGGWIHIGEI